MDNVRSAKDGGLRRNTGQSPAKGLDLPFQARSSAELKKMALGESNARNRAQLKWLHRMGPKNFSLTRETRKGSRGKQLDVETGKVFSQLQEMAEKKGSDTEAFQAVLGKELPCRLRCYGRNITKTSLKRKVEINALKQAHSQEVSTKMSKRIT